MTPYSRRFLYLVSICVGCGSSARDDDDNDDESTDSTGGVSGDGDGDGDSDGSGGMTPGSGGRGASTGGSTPAAGGGLGFGGDGGVGGEGASDGLGGAATGGRPAIDMIPSPGCASGTAEPADIEGQFGPIYVSVPPGYDGSTPLPLVLGFHAFGSVLNELVAESSGLENPNLLPSEYIIARPRALEFEANTWEGQDIEVYDALYEEIAEAVCFDEARVYGIGNAAGARFLTSVACAPARQDVVRPRDFRALALVGNVYSTCAQFPEVPTAFIHSEEDEIGAQFGDADGQEMLAEFREEFDCSETSTEAGTTTYPPTDITYECADLDGCTAPFRFCSHATPTDVDYWHQPHNVEIHRFFSDY